MNDKELTLNESYTETASFTENADILLNSQEKSSATEESKSIHPAVVVSVTGIGMFMGALDESIINVSLPTISNYFGVDQVTVQWIVLVYLLTVVGLTALAGYLGDRFSTKLIYQIGMVIFALGSLFCALSVSIPMLVLSRFIQGLGSTGLLANGNAIVTRFTSEEKRGLAIGFTSLVAALGVVMGPILGGVMTQFWGWQSVFWINVPVGIIGIILIQFIIPPTPPINNNHTKPDIFGSLIFAVFMTIFILAIALFVDPILNKPMMWSGILFGISAILLTVFILWERWTKSPFLDFSLFKNKKITIGFFCSLITFIALNSVAFQLPFFLQDMLSYTQLKIGLIIMGVPIGLAIGAPVAGKLSSKIDARFLSSFGLIAISVELTILAVFLSLTLPLWVFILISSLIGLSIGTFSAPNSNSVLTASPEEKLGVVSSLISLARNIGFSIGTALSTTIFTFICGIFQTRYGGELKCPANYLPSIRILFGVLVVFTAIAAVISFFRGPEAKNNFLEEKNSTLKEPITDLLLDNESLPLD